MIDFPKECHSRLIAGRHPEVLPCGHVKLFKGEGRVAEWAVMKLEDAIEYSCELQRVLKLALGAAQNDRDNPRAGQ